MCVEWRRRRKHRKCNYVLNEGVKDRMQGNKGSTLCISMMPVEVDLPAVYPSQVGNRLRKQWNGMENG